MIQTRLSRLDARASEGAWTLRTLEALESHPGVRAGDLCVLVGQEKERFRINVRKRRNRGLTESLGTGYRLSPRGEAVIQLLRTKGGGDSGHDPSKGFHQRSGEPVYRGSRRSCGARPDGVRLGSAAVSEG